MKCFLFSINLFALAIIATQAQTNDSKTVVASKPIAALVNYALQNGSASVAETYILKPLQLGEQDLPVIQQGWKTRDDGMNHMIAISKNNNADVMLFLFNGKGMGVCWLTSPSGQLRGAVKFDRSTHTAEVVPNDKVAGSFELEKKYLLYRASAAQKSSR